MENQLVDRAVTGLLSKEIKISNTILDLTHIQGKVIDVSFANAEMYQQARVENGFNRPHMPEDEGLMVRIKIQGKWGDQLKTDWFYLEEKHVDQLINTLELK